MPITSFWNRDRLPEKVEEQRLAVYSKVGSNVGENAVQRAGPQWFVVWHSNVMFGATDEAN
jgi:hypothetical protein